MKNNTQKTLILLLSLVMAFTMMTAPVYAENEYQEITMTIGEGIFGTMSWTETEGADSYLLYLGEILIADLSDEDNGNFYLNYNLDNWIETGAIEKPADDNYELIMLANKGDSIIGRGEQIYHYETKATKLTDIKAKIEDGILSWEPVAGATVYRCYVDNNLTWPDSLSLDLKYYSDVWYTEGEMDNTPEHDVGLYAYNDDNALLGSWEGVLEYAPRHIELNVITEIDLYDIYTDIRAGEKVKFTTRLESKDLRIVYQEWHTNYMEKILDDESEELPGEGDILNYAIGIQAAFGSKFDDDEKLVLRYNGKAVSPGIVRQSDRYIELSDIIPPVTVGADTGGLLDRNAGSDRYETAFKAADKLKKELGVTKFENIVIASGTNFPDALAGAYLAKVKNAPILLTRKQNAAAVADYVKKNMEAGGTVFILGGTGAVPTDMEAALKTQGITKTKRLQGANRYQTNIAILQEAGVEGEDVLVCSGKGYADSLSASATGRPVLLVGGSLLPDQKKYLESIKSEISGNIYAIGGPGAVSEAVFKEVCAYARGKKARVAGDTRYTTSKAVADKFFPGVHDTVVLAYAQNYPDGLAGGPVAYAMNSPLLLVINSKTAAAKEYASAHGSVKCLILGGPTLISDAAALAIVK